MIRQMLAILLCSCTVQADALSDLIGPTIPWGTGPWGYYEYTSRANADEVVQAYLLYKPQLGTAYTGTWTLVDSCLVTLVAGGGGATIAEFSVGDWIITAWNTVDGNNTGRFRSTVTSKAGSTLTLDTCQLTSTISLTTRTGLTVYRCGAQCKDAVPNPVPFGGDLYNCSTWGVCVISSPFAAFYDPGLAEYTMNRRTSNAAYLTTARDFTDTWWEWGVDHGGKYWVSGTGGETFYSQFVRALDGHTERLTPLYTIIKYIYDSSASNIPVNGIENRQTGYGSMYLALGAKSDTDATHRSYYCSTMTTTLGYWLARQQSNGMWPEKSDNSFPFTTTTEAYGTSPWTTFAIQRAMAIAYDDYLDPSICNNPSFSATILASLIKSAQFQHDYGYAANSSRGIYYDVGFSNSGVTPPPLLSGTISITNGSTAVVGIGTTFLSNFLVGDFIDILNGGITAWVHKATNVIDNTHMTLNTTWGSQSFSGQQGTTQETGNVSGAEYTRTPPSNNNCASLAANCFSLDGSGSPTLNGDIDSNRDVIWITGWLYNKTADVRWKNYGDEYFAAAYGGPADGVGGSLPCNGPACSSIESQYPLAIHACAVDPTRPCLTGGGFPGGDAYAMGVKRWAQGSGIGGADNYLAWRLGIPSQPTSISLRGRAAVRGNVGIR